MIAPETILALAAAALGAILGSFLNALSFRFNTGVSIMHGRSRCMRCGHVLAWYDLIPLLSYALLGGTCRYCASRVSLQYPLVEAAGALLALGVYLLHPEPPLFVLHLALWMVLLFIVVYDLRHTIIPWSCSAVLALLAFGSLFVSAHGLVVPSIFSLIAGPLVALPLVLLSLVSSGRWMGWGDGALELSLGWFLGLSEGFTGLMLAVWTGALVGSVLLAVSKRVTMKSEIPFAPFLGVGAALAYFFHVDLFSTLPLLW